MIKLHLMLLISLFFKFIYFNLPYFVYLLIQSYAHSLNCNMQPTAYLSMKIEFILTASNSAKDK